MGQQVRFPILSSVVRQLRKVYPDFKFAPWGHRRVSGVLSMVYVGLVMAMGYYVMMVMTLNPMFDRAGGNIWIKWILWGLFHGFVGLMVLCYLLTVFADAGSVDDYEGIGKGKRYCGRCKIYKPERGHHCRVCARCVVKMDHHCIFIGNHCIGDKNQKYFLLFVYYAFFCAGGVGVFCLGDVVGLVKRFVGGIENVGVGKVVGVVVGYFVCVVHAMALGGFAGFQSFLVGKNMTMIEFYDRRCGLGEGASGDDKGFWNNWKLVFGQRWVFWFLPVRIGVESLEGDGMA